MAKQSQNKAVPVRDEVYGLLNFTSLKDKQSLLRELKNKKIELEIIFYSLSIQQEPGEKTPHRMHCVFFKHPEEIKKKLRAANLGPVADRVRNVNEFELKESEWQNSTLTWVNMAYTSKK